MTGRHTRPATPPACRRLFFRPPALVLLALFAIPATGGPAGGGETVQLRPDPLTHPDRVAVLADLTDAGGAILSGRIVEGGVAPSNWIRLNRDHPEATLSLAGTEAVFRMAEGGVRVDYAGGTHRLEKVGGRLPPLSLDGGRIRLAFPRAFLLRTRAVLAPRSGLLRAGTLEGRPLALLDHPLDGRYAAGEDAWRLGSGAAFAPLRTFLPTAGRLWRVGRLLPDGSALHLAEAETPTGRVRIDWAGPEPGPSVVFESGDGRTAFAATPGTDWTLPAGAYRLRFGLLSAPAGTAGQTPPLRAVIRPGACGFRLRPGETRTVRLGEPFTLVPEVTLRDGHATLVPSGLRLEGASGALYGDLPPEGPDTEMTVRKGDWTSRSDACIACGGGLVSIRVPLPETADGSPEPGTYEVRVRTGFAGLGRFEGAATLYVPEK
jgi:hypothetical protein